MRTLLLTMALVVAGLLAASPVRAQDPPPKIGPFVVDVQGTWPGFPNDDPQLADSRDLLMQELPHRGLGLHGGVHVYPARWKAVTFGLGVDATVARAHKSKPQLTSVTYGRAVTERFSHIAPEISFNFGDGDGWSYISGGIGPGVWSVVPDLLDPAAPDLQRVETINYGGGARWFLNKRLAFSIDARFYAVAPTTPLPGNPSGPRTTLFFMGAGVSLK